jgi:hypothetical protein
MKQAPQPIPGQHIVDVRKIHLAAGGGKQTNPVEWWKDWLPDGGRNRRMLPPFS